MNYADAIAYFRTQVNLAAALRIRQPTVSDWKRNGGTIPDHFQYRLHYVTRGALALDPHLDYYAPPDAVAASAPEPEPVS